MVKIILNKIKIYHNLHIGAIKNVNRRPQNLNYLLCLYGLKTNKRKYVCKDDIEDLHTLHNLMLRSF